MAEDTLFHGPMDIQAILARLDRDRAEERKLREESEKLVAEQKMLMAEERKLKRDTWLAPWALLSAIVGGVIVAVANHLFR